MVKPPNTPEEWKTFVLQFIASISLCDHMGDVSNDVNDALEIMGYTPEWYEWDDLHKWLYNKGITTLNGTEMGGYDE